MTLEPQSTPVELLPFTDFVSCVPPSDQSSHIFELAVVQRDATFGKVVHLEFDCKSVELREKWVLAIEVGMTEAFQQASLPQGPDSRGEVHNPTYRRARVSLHPFVRGVLNWIDWFKFPVQSLLQATIPDVHKPHLRKWYPVSFVMSMVWLGIFAFCVIEICDILHEEFNISSSILGFTVAAIGTSFPNVVSCIAVSRQGRTGMAIANSLGANIQNVFLALALPWVVQCFMNGGSFKPPVDDLFVSVMWMFATLGLMVLIVVLAGCKMPKWSGVTFLATYAFYLVMQLGEEITECASWPFVPCE